MLVPLKFKPGLVRDMTMYANQGGWYDCDKIRFRMGLPEKIGGWIKQMPTAFLGVCRNLINWTVLSGEVYTGIGTNLKFYVTTGDEYTDVTPLRRSVTLGANPFASTSGSVTLRVTDAGHGCTEGDFVTFSGAISFASIPAASINQEHRVVTVVSINTYTIEVDTAASVSTNGGGAAVDADYQINIGLSNSVPGLGWGAGVWGGGTWGTPRTSGPQLSLRIWYSDTFGEDLVTNIRNGGLYLWDATNPSDRMVALDDLVGASDAPVVATQVMVSSEENHVIALGCDQIGGAGDQDPLMVRWSDADSVVDWTPVVTNSAGGYRLSLGTYIVGAVHTRSEILIWTDVAMYSMRWTGAPYTFSFTQIAFGINILSPNAATTINDISIWMGREQFYIYDGRVSPLPCPVSDYIFNRINVAQVEKIYGFTNSIYDEVGWLYPSNENGNEECDSYVIYNYKDQAWYYGSLPRTAWLDRGPGYYPSATSVDSYLYSHEYGFDDGSTTPASAITAYIESSPMESPDEGAGDHFLFLSRIIPDVTFRNSTAENPSVDMTLKVQDYPGQSFAQTQNSLITQSSTVTVEQFTTQAFIRLRGRSMVFRCESNDTGVGWRLGIPRVDVRADGRR